MGKPGLTVFSSLQAQENQYMQEQEKQKLKTREYQYAMQTMRRCIYNVLYQSEKSSPPNASTLTTSRLLSMTWTRSSAAAKGARNLKLNVGKELAQSVERVK